MLVIAWLWGCYFNMLGWMGFDRVSSRYSDVEIARYNTIYMIP